MSNGMTPYDFVQRVFYQQEKVLLDFVPDDDKYKEVIVEANMVLEELQKEEDWLWLRTSYNYGLVDREHQGPFTLPEDFYKPSTMFDDGGRLYAHGRCSNPNGHPCGWSNDNQIDSPDYTKCVGDCWRHFTFLWLPWVSAGFKNDRTLRQTNRFLRPNVIDTTLGLSVIDNKVQFNRILLPHECGRIFTIDYQRLIKPLHLCTEECVGVDDSQPVNYDYDATSTNYRHWKNPCSIVQDECTDKVLTEITDPLYVVLRTAQYHAQGSPTAMAQITPLADQAQRLLSAMRENNAAGTMPDYIPHWVPGYHNII